MSQSHILLSSFTAELKQNWLNKPDGGGGWASWFLDHGYEVYIVDQVHTGRSAWSPKSAFPQTVAPVEYIQRHFTATKNYPLWPQAHDHAQWPGVRPGAVSTYEIC